MRILLCTALMAVAVQVAAQAENSPKASKAESTVIPQGATQVDAYTFRHKDAKGKTWVYRKTPFGVSKAEAVEAGEAAASPAPLAIPAGAIQQEANVYRHTDADGKVWIYRKTPFGISRTGQNASAPVEASASAPENFKVKDLGESVQFERPGPFGMYRWTRKKTEMTTVEKTVWQHHQTAAKGGK